MSAIGLLTGSAPFGGLPDNPAEELLARFDGREIGGCVIRTRLMPVSRAGLPSVIETLVAEHRPAFVVSLGLATGAPVFALEQIALNAADFGVTDNEGYAAEGERIEPDGPEARFASWDAKALKRRLLAADLPARTSWHAGTHLCNLTLYCFLGALAKAGLAHVPCGFFHLPYTPEQVARFLRDAEPDVLPATPRALPSLPLELQARAVETVLAGLADAGRPAPGGDP